MLILISHTIRNVSIKWLNLDLHLLLQKHDGAIWSRSYTTICVLSVCKCLLFYTIIHFRPWGQAAFHLYRGGGAYIIYALWKKRDIVAKCETKSSPCVILQFFFLLWGKSGLFGLTCNVTFFPDMRPVIPIRQTWANYDLGATCGPLSFSNRPNQTWTHDINSHKVIK